jgi:membrane protein
VIILAKRGASLSACAARYWMSDSASTLGAALAFYCAFSLAPLLIILITISGWFVGAKAAYGDMYVQLSSLFGPSTARILVEAAKASQQNEGWVATTVSIVTLLIGATSVLAALESALQLIWNSVALARSGIMGWIRTRFLSLGFILALGFLLLVSLSISTALANVRAHVIKQHAALVGTIGVLDFVISLFLVSSLFALIYRYMPARRLPWRVVFIGGVLTAALFDAGRWVIGLYLAHSTQPSAFGAAASFAALLLWLYYTAQIFLFGAEFTACLGGVREKEVKQIVAKSALGLGLAPK